MQGQVVWQEMDKWDVSKLSASTRVGIPLKGLLWLLGGRPQTRTGCVSAARGPNAGLCAGYFGRREWPGPGPTPGGRWRHAPRPIPPPGGCSRTFKRRQPAARPRILHTRRHDRDERAQCRVMVRAACEGRLWTQQAHQTGVKACRRGAVVGRARDSCRGAECSGEPEATWVTKW